MNIKIKNKQSDEIKEIKVGFSWPLAFFGALGFYYRGLYKVSATLMILTLILEILLGLKGLMIGVYIVGIIMAIKGNEITTKYYLQNGWEYLEPDSDAVKKVKEKWNNTLIPKWFFTNDPIVFNKKTIDNIKKHAVKSNKVLEELGDLNE